MRKPETCYGPADDQHAAGCTPSKPCCRWRRAATRCCCSAYHFPHRKGSGVCGSTSRAQESVWGAEAAIVPAAMGEAGLTLKSWWCARAEVADAFMANGGAMVHPELAARARAVLTGAAAPAAEPLPARTLKGSELRAWWTARRAAVDLLLPFLSPMGGAVVPPELAARVRGLLTGHERAPRQPNARTLKTTKAAPLAWTAPKRELEDAPF